LAGRTDKAYSVLEKALTQTDDTMLTSMIQGQICYLNAEMAMSENMLEPEELDAYLQACNSNKGENKSGSININEKKKEVNIENGRFKDSGLKVYPNPVTGQSQILAYSENDNVNVIKIYDITGKIVSEFELKEGNNLINISNSVFSEGIYQIVIFKNGIASENCKMVIIK